MAIQLHLPPIIELDGRLCLVVKDWANFDEADGRLLGCGPFSIVTEDGYPIGDRRVLDGEVPPVRSPLRMHPWPPHD